MKRILYGLIIGFCLIPNIVNALECSTADRERLQKLANNISVAIEEYEENGETYFKATFAGLSKDLRVYSDRKQFYYHNFSSTDIGEFEVQPLYSGKIYQFTVNGNSNCAYEDFRTITINVPNVNQFYGDTVCEGAKEYKMCQKWFNSDGISYEEFKDKVNSYINNKNENGNGNNGVGENNNEFDFYFDFKKFYSLVYFPSLVVTIILLILLIIFWNKENKKNRL